MATVNVYIDGTTLSNSTAVYTDAGLTTCATAGFYSDGSISREQVIDAAGKCSLLPNQTCATCGVTCGEDIVRANAFGLFLLDTNLGDGAADTGAVVIRYTPSAVPNGIKVEYNGVTYNKLSAPAYGKLQSTGVNDPFTFVGDTSLNCGFLGVNTPTEYEYDGSTFVLTGNTPSVTVNSVDLALTATAPGECVMVIPKTTALPVSALVKLAGFCAGTSFQITVECPTQLTSFAASLKQVSDAAACAETTYPVTLYNVPVTGTAGVPALHDYVFTDVNGEFAPNDGFYKTVDGGVEYSIQVVDGIIEAVITCP